MVHRNGARPKRLRLKVNQEKSAVDRPWNRSFLGYSMTWHKLPRLRVAPESVRRLRAKLKVAFRMGRRSEEHTSELQSRGHLVCRLLLEKKKDGVRLEYVH